MRKLFALLGLSLVHGSNITSITDIFGAGAASLDQFKALLFDNGNINTTFEGTLCADDMMMSVYQATDFPSFSLMNTDSFVLNDGVCGASTLNVVTVGDQVFAYAPLDGCGTVPAYGDGNTTIHFTNTLANSDLQTQLNDPTNTINIYSAVALNMTCVYSMSYELTADPKTSSTELTNNATEVNSFSMEMNFHDVNSTAWTTGDRVVEMTYLESHNPLDGYKVGKLAYFTLEMEHPNNFTVLGVNNCTMQAATGGASFQFIEGGAGNIWTSTCVQDNIELGVSLVSFTMFEFVAVAAPATQTNTLTCTASVCLKSDCYDNDGNYAPTANCCITTADTCDSQLSSSG